jgi:hypothetical protein
MPAQDRARCDQAMTTQRLRRPLDQGGEHGPVRPVHVRSRVGAAQHSDLKAQQEELEVLGGGRADREWDQSEHRQKIKYSSRNDTAGSCPPPDHRWSATQPEFWNPHRADGDRG